MFSASFLTNHSQLFYFTLIGREAELPAEKKLPDQFLSKNL